MKGFVELPSVLLFLIICILVVVATFVHYIITQMPWGPGSISYKIEFADIAIKPYLIAEAFTHYEIGDRGLIERSIQSIAVRHLDPGIEDPLKNFIGTYNYIMGGDSNNLKYELTLKDDSEDYLIIGEKKRGYDEAIIPLLYKDKIGYLTISTGE